jgi:hypothetical protein
MVTDYGLPLENTEEIPLLQVPTGLIGQVGVLPFFLVLDAGLLMGMGYGLPLVAVQIPLRRVQMVLLGLAEVLVLLLRDMV